MSNQNPYGKNPNNPGGQNPHSPGNPGAAPNHGSAGNSNGNSNANPGAARPFGQTPPNHSPSGQAPHGTNPNNEQTRVFGAQGNHGAPGQNNLPQNNPAGGAGYPGGPGGIANSYGNNQVPSSHNGGGGGGKALPIILGLVLVVALAIGALFLVGKKDDSDSENAEKSSTSTEASPNSDTSSSSSSSASPSSSSSSSSSALNGVNTAAPDDVKKWGGDDTLPAKYRSGLPADTSTMVRSCRNGTARLYHYERGQKIDDGRAPGTRCSMGKTSPSPYSSVEYITSVKYAKDKIKEAEAKNYKVVKDDKDAYVTYLKEGTYRGVILINPSKGHTMEIRYPKEGSAEMILKGLGFNVG